MSAWIIHPEKKIWDIEYGGNILIIPAYPSRKVKNKWTPLCQQLLLLK